MTSVRTTTRALPFAYAPLSVAVEPASQSALESPLFSQPVRHIRSVFWRKPFAVRADVRNGDGRVGEGWRTGCWADRRSRRTGSCWLARSGTPPSWPSEITATIFGRPTMSRFIDDRDRERDEGLIGSNHQSTIHTRIVNFSIWQKSDTGGQGYRQSHRQKLDCGSLQLVLANRSSRIANPRSLRQGATQSAGRAHRSRQYFLPIFAQRGCILCQKLLSQKATTASHVARCGA